MWLGIVVAAAAFEFRAQIFLLLAPALMASLLCETAHARRHARAVIVAAAVTVVAVIVCLVTWKGARDAWLRFSALRPFLDVVHSGMSPTAYDGAYAAIEREYGPIVGTTAGVLALIPAAMGAWALALPIAGAAAMRRTGWRALDTFPIWCVAAWLGLVLFAPMAHGDYTEFQQRPFVLIYASAVVWTILFFERGMPVAGPSAARLRLVLSSTLVAAIATSAVARRHEDPARPRFAWGMRNFDTRLERGFIDAAAFVRTHAARGDTFALIPTDPTSRLDDDATRLAALAGVPAYLARAGIQASNSPARRLVVEQRLSELHGVETASDANAAFADPSDCRRGFSRDDGRSWPIVRSIALRRGLSSRGCGRLSDRAPLTCFIRPVQQWRELSLPSARTFPRFLRGVHTCPQLPVRARVGLVSGAATW